MSTSTEPIMTTGARRPGLDHRTAMRLAAEEYRQFARQLRELTPTDWTKPTACPEWDVRQLTCHVVGMAEFAGSTLEQMRQMRAAKRAGGFFLDALTALQVRKHIERPIGELPPLLETAGARAARHRSHAPALIRRAAMKDQPIDEYGADTETWAYGFLIDIILTRDTWMHRSDIATATDRAMVVTAEHDGVLVADVAAEWAGRHAQPCSLTLTGPAGGQWRWGEDGPDYRRDAVEFCRTISGRGDSVGLLATRVPF